MTDGSNKKAGSTCVGEADCLVSERLSVSLPWPLNARWHRYSWTCCYSPAEEGVQFHQGALKESCTNNIFKKKKKDLNGLQCKCFCLMLKENSWINMWIKWCRQYWQQKHSMHGIHFKVPFANFCSQTDFTLAAVTDRKIIYQIPKVRNELYLAISIFIGKVRLYSFVQTSRDFQPFASKGHEKCECKTKKKVHKLNRLLKTEGQSHWHQLIKTI